MEVYLVLLGIAKWHYTKDILYIIITSLSLKVVPTNIGCYQLLILCECMTRWIVLAPVGPNVDLSKLQWIPILILLGYTINWDYIFF